MSDREERDEILKGIERAGILEEGMRSPFWEHLKDLLDRMSRQAIEELLVADNKDYALIATLQVRAGIGKEVERIMKDSIEYASTYEN